MLVYTRQKNIAQVFILERYFFDVYILASRTCLPKISSKLGFLHSVCTILGTEEGV